MVTPSARRADTMPSAKRIQIQVNLIPPSFFNPNLIQLLQIQIWIRIQLDTEGPRRQQASKVKISRGVIESRNLESIFESESTLLFFSPNPDSRFLALNSNANPKREGFRFSWIGIWGARIQIRIQDAWIRTSLQCVQSFDAQIVSNRFGIQ